MTVAEVSEFAGVTPSTVRRWIRAGRLTSAVVSGRLTILWDDKSAFLMNKFFERFRKPEAAWVPPCLVNYVDWHSVIDEIVWLLKVTYSSRDALKSRDFRLDHLLQQHILTNVVSLKNAAAILSLRSVIPHELVASDLRRAWYNELALLFPLRSATLGLRFSDIDMNKVDANARLAFPSWRFIQAYYAAYFYVRCLCMMKLDSFRRERHVAPLNVFTNCVLPACGSVLWPWPLSICYVHGRRVPKTTLPIHHLNHLQYNYARHPRSPYRTPQECYESIRARFKKSAKAKNRTGGYSIMDFLYEFRVWANYQNIDDVLALWGSGYRSIIDMNLCTILFFVGSASELAVIAALGEETYLVQLQHLYDTFVCRNSEIRRQFPNTALYQRLTIYKGMGLVRGSIQLATKENPHAVQLFP